MKKHLLLLSLLAGAISTQAQVYSSMNISLLGTLDPCATENWYGAPNAHTKYSSLVGWVNPADNKEYAIMGGADGVYFIEVTNPSAPVLRDFEQGINTSCLWREMKTYGNYCYMVSDDAMPNGMMIADLSYLPDSIHIIHKSSSIVKTAHTLFVDGNKLYMGGPNTNATGLKSMGVFDLTNPTNPVPLRFLDQDVPSINYVHDMWVQNDTIFASCGNQGLYVLKLNSNNTFSQIASYTMYVQAGYNHSSYRTENKKTLVFCDEVPTNTVVKILDVSNLSNMTMLDTIKSHQGATPHNPYISGDTIAYVAYYQDGLYAFDISDPANVTVAGYFDTHYQNGHNNGFPGSPTPYMGAWAAWPYLPSGNLLVSDMQNGLFVLDVDSLVSTGTKKNALPKTALNVFPNPATDALSVSLLNEKGSVYVDITDVSGRIVRSEQIQVGSIIHNFTIDVKGLAKGVYVLSINSKDHKTSKEFIKQ